MNRDFHPNHAFKARGSYIEGSLQNRIRQFFIANPDEELSYHDMTVKFGCTLIQAHGAVRELLKRDGAKSPLESIHIVRGRAVPQEATQGSPS